MNFYFSALVCVILSVYVNTITAQCSGQGVMAVSVVAFNIQYANGSLISKRGDIYDNFFDKLPFPTPIYRNTNGDLDNYINTAPIPIDGEDANGVIHHHHNLTETTYDNNVEVHTSNSQQSTSNGETAERRDIDEASWYENGKRYTDLSKINRQALDTNHTEASFKGELKTLITFRFDNLQPFCFSVEEVIKLIKVGQGIKLIDADLSQI